MSQGYLRYRTIFVAAVLLFAALTRISLLSDPLVDDEFFHVLTAESWWKSRELAMLDGIYSRSELFTKLVALAFSFAGDTSWVAARIFPSVLTGVLTIGLVSWWVHKEIGGVAALFTAFLLIFWPDGIDVSQFIRFYALHGLFFSLGVITFYYAAIRDSASWWVRALLAGVSAISFILALQLQVISIAGVAGMLTWFCLVFVLPVLARSRLWLFAAIGVSCAAAAVFFLAGFDRVFADLWSVYRTLPPGWDHDFTFYHRYLRGAYPTIWPLLPLIFVIALNRAPKLASLCIAIFLAALLMLSLGHRVQMRYLYHATPFLFVIWGIAASCIWQTAWSFVRRQSDAAVEQVGITRFRKVFGTGAMCLILAFAVLSNAAFPRAARLAMGASGGELLGDPRIAWNGAADLVRPWAEEGALIVTSRTMITIAYLGDFDVAFSPLSVHDVGASATDPEAVLAGRAFVDPRDGRPLIGTRTELLRLVSCTPVGIALSPNRNQAFLEMFFVEGKDLPIETSIERAGPMRLISWRNTAVAADAECQDLPIPQDGGAAGRIVRGEAAPSMGPNRAWP